jgi:hypothetical protein
MVDPAAYAVKLGWQSTQWQLPLRVYSVEKLGFWRATGSGGSAGSMIIWPVATGKWARKRPY